MAQTDTYTKEGHLQAPGGRVWYKVVSAEAPGLPLLVLHGGPGAGHDYLEPLTALAGDRPVVLYDQLGCGKSEIPDDASLWHAERFVEELGAVRRQLGLERAHLLGQSWGGWLAIEYMLSKPAGVVSLTLANTSASVDDFIADASEMKAELPAEVRETIERCEAEGTTDSPEYQAACMAFYQRHLCRLAAWPPEMLRSMANVTSSPVYGTMWGPSEFTVTGTLKGWDRSSRLSQITVPTLILSGAYDEMGPRSQETLRRGIPHAQYALFKESSHTPQFEEPDLYIATLRDFLAQAEKAAA